MDVIYLGPSESVNVAPFGDHRKGQLKQYPDEFGADLIATSKKNKFEAVATPEPVGRVSNPTNEPEALPPKKTKKGR